MSSYDKDNLESVLRYLAGEYGIEILAGQGRIAGKNDIMKLLPDFFSLANHKGDSSMLGAMYREGVLKSLVALKLSGSSEDECRRRIQLEIRKLTETFLPEDVSAKYVQMIARVIGLKVPAGMPVNTGQAGTPPEPSPKTQRQSATMPKRPAMSDAKFWKLCETGSTQEVEEALRNGADVNARDKHGETALMKAAIYGRTEVAEALLKHGANVNARDKEGRSILMLAAIYGRTEVAEALLKYGANVNARDKEGRTSLIVSARRDSAKLAEVLLRHGADVNAMDKSNQTALMAAERTGHADTAKLLRSYGAKI